MHAAAQKERVISQQSGRDSESTMLTQNSALTGKAAALRRLPLDQRLSSNASNDYVGDAQESQRVTLRVLPLFVAFRFRSAPRKQVEAHTLTRDKAFLDFLPGSNRVT